MRQIIHLDLDAFYASVEVLLNPELKDKPLIVSMGSLNSRGVVATASYPARTFGVHSAMPLREAVRLCPQAIIVPVRHRLYSEHSHRVMNLLREFSPLVEQVSIDEAYIEIPGDRDAVDVAKQIQARITTELGLSCTLAVATNKLLSKVACNTVKPHGFIRMLLFLSARRVRASSSELSSTSKMTFSLMVGTSGELALALRARSEPVRQIRPRLRRCQSYPSGGSPWSVKKNVAPRPTSPSAHTLPPCRCTIRATVASPTPVPAKSLLE